MSKRLLNEDKWQINFVGCYQIVPKCTPIIKELFFLAYGARNLCENYLEDQQKLKDKKGGIARETEERLREKMLNEEKLKNWKGFVDKLKKGSSI